MNPIETLLQELIWVQLYFNLALLIVGSLNVFVLMWLVYLMTSPRANLVYDWDD